MDRVVGGYVLEQRLGEGGMGVVFCAHHADAPERKVALKVLRAGRAASPEALERFRREMRALAALSHPNVVRILGGTLEGPEPHFVMELVAGQPLDAVLGSGPLRPREAVTLVRAVATAIETAHAAGILHRDLKPSNVLVESDGRPRILDFGLATAEGGERLTLTGTFLGSEAWAAPEQIVGDAHRADERTDVFALGALLWATLTGRGPFDEMLASGRRRVLGTRCEPPSSVAPEVPRALDAVCARALEEEPERRYPSARALREDLERWLRGEKTSVEASFRRVWVAVAGLAVVAAILVLAPGRGKSSAPAGSSDLDELVAAAASRPGEAPKVAALEAAAAAALAAPEKVVLVGEREDFALGDALLEARDVLLSSRGDADAAALLAAASALADARLARSAGDPAGRALRAYTALAAVGAPRSALDPGELDAVPEAALADLEAASALSGAAGARAAWLLADLRAASGNDAAARAALEGAAARSHGDPRHESLHRVLATPGTPEGLATLLREAREGKTLWSAVVLSRFLARVGAPRACEHPEVAFGTRTERVLARERARSGSFAYLGSRSAAVTAARNAFYEERGRVKGQPVEKRWTELAPLLRSLVAAGPVDAAGLVDADVLGDCGDCERGSLAAPAFLVLASSRVLGWEYPLSDAFCPGVRIGNRGLAESGFYLSPRWETGPGVAGCEEFDRRLAADFASDEIVRLALAHGLFARELDRAMSVVHGLRRLEALENDPPESEVERARLALEGFRGLEDMARLGGGAEAIFRARLRRVVLPPPLGPALARLDLARFARDARASSQDRRSLGQAEAVGRLALGASGVAAELGGAEQLERELFELGAHLVREYAVSAGPDDYGATLTDTSSLFVLNPLYRAVRWRAAGREHAFEARPEDLARMSQRPFVYRAP